jgi:hypothetical protein
MPELIEDPRVERPLLCGVTTLVAGHEFICIRPAHGNPQRTDQWERHRPAGWQRHYFVRRYPYAGSH